MNPTKVWSLPFQQADRVRTAETRDAFCSLAEYCPRNLTGFDRSAAIRPNAGLYASGLSDLTQRHHPGWLNAGRTPLHSETFSKSPVVCLRVVMMPIDKEGSVFEFFCLGYAK